MPTPLRSFLAVLLVLVPMATYGQPPASATVRIRVHENPAVVGDTGDTIVGELLHRDSSALVVVRFDPPERIRIPIERIDRAEYLRATGRDGGRTLRTAVLIGAGVGAVAGFVAGSQTSSHDCIVLCSAGVVAAVGGGAGAVAGLIVGIPIAAATGDRWERFEPTDVRVSAALVPVPHGVGLALRWTP